MEATISPTGSTAVDASSGPGVAVSYEGVGHVEEGTDIQYENFPPASGRHYPRWAEYGVYSESIPAPYWVHNLEHGAIVLLYRCPSGQEDCPEVVERLEALYYRTPPGKYGEAKLVVTQEPSLDTPFVALAWNRMLELDQLDEDRFLEFYKAWVDKGPEDVP